MILYGSCLYFPVMKKRTLRIISLRSSQTVACTTEQQLTDYLFVAEETSAYLLGNALALLEPDAQEAEIKSFVEDLRRVIAYAQKKLGSDQLPN